MSSRSTVFAAACDGVIAKAKSGMIRLEYDNSDIINLISEYIYTLEDNSNTKQSAEASMIISLSFAIQDTTIIGADDR